ncbi:cation:proton antiporter [Lactobacillus jensenii]|uniref:Cation:proton antiporter n=1 Tax=Lactobacillus jensenii TaxID=109790 RepID=A0A5N1I9P1_LACJE|nr:cation:proton antiporter family protein [Lactobacillus jensenii]APT14123.1 potassium transporter [Lactobacillus jensenii]EEQ23951.1 TrkA C-terminal domain protein [Lactobacillus jensenii 269-3]EEX27206.1 TrkA C-terminal domain protein [Lactobacillus jensenii SJ-7A-US]KAA9234303.1 potassium transporter [Lactobacillus jensenii]KAA9258263.1 potassium transporter [Lactobacillus jensenii]
MLLVILMALVIPIWMAKFNLHNIPTAVAEIIVGIVLGVSGFNWVDTSNSQLSFLSNLGVIILIFLSGMEIEFDLFKKKQDSQINPVKIALLSFLGIAAFSIFLGWILSILGLFKDMLLASIIFMTVALGVVIATLKEKEILSKSIGQSILLTAVLGEVVPLLGLTIYASIHGGDAEKLWLIILLFVAAIVLLIRFKRPYLWFNKITKQTTQIDIRLAFFLIFVLVSIAEKVGAENILGAFLAGMVMKLLEPSEATKDKLTSIGYGFFIPFFFIMTGAKLNLKSLFTNQSALLLLPILVLAFFVSKVPAVLTYLKYFTKRNALAGGLLTATTITIVLPTLQVARKLNAISKTQSDAFTLAAIITCIAGPIIFNSLFKLAPEDKIKEKVLIYGANVFSVAVAQELHDKWYSVEMITDDQEAYNTYKSRVKSLKYCNNVLAINEFNYDIVASSGSDDERNYEFAKKAKQAGVSRVIVRQKQPEANRIAELTQLDIEVFNGYSARTSAMRALIESPAFYEILTDSDNILYDVKIRNHRYAGHQLMDLSFIDKITVSRIKRDGEWLAPHGTTVLEVGDEIVYTGKVEDADMIRELLTKEN